MFFLSADYRIVFIIHKSFDVTCFFSLMIIELFLLYTKAKGCPAQQLPCKYFMTKVRSTDGCMRRSWVLEYHAPLLNFKGSCRRWWWLPANRHWWVWWWRWHTNNWLMPGDGVWSRQTSFVVKLPVIIAALLL